MMPRIPSIRSKSGSGETTNNNKTSIRPSTLQYFYGRITREEAELFLQERGGREGLFLLRESISPMGNYAISISHGSRVHHYSIEKQVDGTYKIPEGKPFPGPVELIQYYQQHTDGFVTKPSIPCDRFSGQSPVAFRGITYYQLEKAMQLEAKKLNAAVDITMGPMRDSLVKRVAQSLHRDMPWFHDKISRLEAENRLARDGHEEGKFLVRLRDEKNTYALTLSCNNQARHYFIAQRQDNRFAIEEGPRFDCLMMLVDNYHNKSDGLACKLRQPCCRPGYSSIDYELYMINNTRARKDSVTQHVAACNGAAKSPTKRELPPLPTTCRSDRFSEDPAEFEEDHPEVRLDMNVEDLESVYGSASLRREVNARKLQPSQVRLEELKLGAGNFGSVMKGVCRLGGEEIPVAVKTLKNADMQPGIQSELIQEAEVMMKMDHKHIVRMIGIVEGDPLMLVLELAKLGPMNKFLPKNKDLPLWNILQLMWQVAQGMEYLEASNFVHRDLAARNILLCDQHFAKISDFGMSKTLSRENNYYQAQQAGKWPLKWYALECINFWKFDSKSDVWSFGITLWEAASYGAKPYYKMKGQEMVEFLTNGNRLAKPISCSDEVYDVMLQCWKERKEDRPTFRQLVSVMNELFISHQRSHI